MDLFENSFEDSRQDVNLNSSPRIFRGLEGYSNNYIGAGVNSNINNRLSSPKRDRHSLRGSWDGTDSIEQMMDGNRRSESFDGGFLDNTGSIGETISKLIAASKRRTPRVTPPDLDNVEVGQKEEEEEGEHLSKREKILMALNSHTVRKSLSEKAIVKWYEIVAQFNEVSRNMGDPALWEEYMSKAFSKDMNIKIFEQLDSENTCFNFCFPMLFVIWGALRRCGQKGLEIKPTRPRAQALSNGSIVIEDQGCSFTSQWKGGSRLERKFDLKASLDLRFMIRWIEFNFIDRAVADWYAVSEVTEASLSNSHMVQRLAQLINLAQSAGNLPQVTPQSDIESLPSSSASSLSPASSSLTNETAIKELNSYIKAFSHLSDTNRHLRARKTLQMTDVMSSLKDLLVYQKEKQIVSPLEALDQYVSQSRVSNQPLIGRVAPVDSALRVDNLRSNDSSFEHLSAISLAKKDKYAKRRKTENRTKAMTAASSTSLASLRLSSSRISKDKTGGCNVIPGTKKIRF